MTTNDANKITNLPTFTCFVYELHILMSENMAVSYHSKIDKKKNLLPHTPPIKNRR